MYTNPLSSCFVALPPGILLTWVGSSRRDVDHITVIVHVGSDIQYTVNCAARSEDCASQTITLSRREVDERHRLQKVKVFQDTGGR